MNENNENMNQQPQPQVQTQYGQPQPQVQTQYGQPQPQVQTQYEQPQPQYQQPQYQQPQMQYGQPQMQYQSSPAPKPKKSRKKLIIILSVILLLIVAGLLVFFLVISPKMKKKQSANVISLAVNKTMSIGSPLQEYLGTDDLAENMCEDPYETTFSLNLDSLSIPHYEKFTPFLTGISLSNGSLITDPENQDFQVSATLNYSVLDLTELSFTCLDDTYGIAAPGLFEGYIYVNKEDLDDLINNIPFVSQSNNNMPDLSIFDNVKPALDKVVNEAQISSLSNKTLQNRAGEDVTCRGYALTISRDNILEFLPVFVNDIIELLNQQTADRSKIIADLENALAEAEDTLTSDFVIEFYINSDGYLMEVYLPDYTVGNTTIGADCTLLGSENVTDQIDCTFFISTADRDNNFRITKDTVSVGSSSTTTTAFYMNEQQLVTYETTLDTSSGYSTQYLSSSVVQISTAGYYSNVKKGTGYQYSCDYFTLQAGDLYVSLSGTVSISPTRVSVTMPSGTGYNMASSSDRESFVKSLQNTLLQNPVFMNLISSFMSGF